MLFPVLDSFDVYETPHQIIIIGSNCEKTVFKILKLSRWTMDGKQVDCSEWFLNVIEDEYTYNYENIAGVIQSIISMTSAKILIENAFGIVGFVRFKQGYYMIMITKRSQVAQLGQHKIYKVDETKMIYLPGNVPSPWDNATKTDFNYYLPQTKHPDEKSYLGLFNSVDLSNDNYFSYTYDLSNTVQYNMSFLFEKDESSFLIFNGINEQQLLINDRFVWNWSLWPQVLKPKKNRLEIGFSWIVALIHGYVGQSCISAGAGCIDIIVCLIARRSRHFAGTRFLKRGSNLMGNVANEVETEQIVMENEGFEFEKSKVTSLVQLRGSIPLQWNQEVMKAIGKPPIKMTTENTYYDVPGRHFANLIYRYGSPILILNLVKQRKSNFYERPLSEKFVESIDYLKSYFKYFNLENDILKHIDFDMARIQRNKSKTVLVKMLPIAEDCIQKTGFFHSDALLKQLSYGRKLLTNTVQCGIVRTNCIDCLDRTNTAQFVIGQAALGYQLFSLGILNTTKITSMRSLDKMLQTLYENHGNVLALQYGGSALVHNVETYRKTAKFSAQSRDFLQALSRYYTNKFSDHEKQMSINLFLGIFKPWQSANETIWHHKDSDVFLHDRYCQSILDSSQFCSSTWLPVNIIAFIPKPLVLWDKWKVLNELYNYALEIGLSRKVKERALNIASSNKQTPCRTDFEKCYTYLIDMITLNRNSIGLFDFSMNLYDVENKSFDIEEFKSQATVFYNGCARWDRSENEKSGQMDSVGTLTSGVVMKALRNEKFNDNKSVSSDSVTDLSDDELGYTEISKKHRQDQANNVNVSLQTNDCDGNKYISFIFKDYSHLSNSVSECVNSSWNYYLKNDKFNLTKMKVIGNYRPSSNVETGPCKNNIYQETIQFNKTGRLKSSNAVIYQQYLNCRDVFQTPFSKIY